MPLELACSKPVLVSFSDLFHGIVDDIVPSGGGPHLFMSYLQHWDLAIAANRKNTDEHVVLLAWSTNDGGKTPIALEFEQEKFIPRIELQENRDENLLLGIDIDRISIHEKLELKIDSEVKVLSPHCILLCLSCEGKLIMFHVARISESACSHETFIKPPDEIAGVKEMSSEVLPILKQIGVDMPDINADKELRSLGGGHSFVVKEQPIFPPTRNEKTDQSSKILQLSVESSPKQGISSAFGNFMKSGSCIVTNTSSSVGSMLSEPSITSQSSKNSFKSDVAGPVSTHADSLQVGLFGLQSMGKTNASYGHTMRSSLSNSSGSIRGNSQGTGGIQRHSISQSHSTCIESSVKISKETSDSTSCSNGSKAPLKPGHAELVPAIRSSPASSMENSIPGKSLILNMQDVLSSRQVYRFPGVQESEPKLSKQFYSVNDMVEELDTLLAYIDREGGFKDACTVIQRSLASSLEEGLKNSLEKFRMCKVKVERQLKEIQQLQDKRMQVSARLIYMEGLVKQASNGQYWDIWNCQKLGPKFEVKRQRISKLNYAVVNELVELERHFNALELNKYGESGPVLKGRRALLGSLESSRQIYSLHSLYNTVNSQLAAAEQLFECLSKQMAVLNINSPPAKQQNIMKELLESIGLEYDSDFFQSPDPIRSGYSPDSSKKTLFLSSSSRAAKEHTRRSTLSALKTFEPESSRRRRDSLDRSWTRFDPPKTTVKRMLQEENFEDSAEKLLSSVKVTSGPSILEEFLASQKGQEGLSSSLQSSMNKFRSRVDKFNEDVQKKLPKQLSESQSDSLFKWTKDISEVGSRFPVTSDMQTSGIQSTPVKTSSFSNALNKMQGFGGLANRSSGEVPYTVRQPDSSTVEVGSLTKARFSAQFNAPVHNQTSVDMSNTIFPSKITSPINAEHSNEPMNVRSGENGLTWLSTGSVGQPVTPAFSISEKSHPSLSSSITGSVSPVRAVTSRSESSGTLSGRVFSTTESSSFPVQSSASASSPFVSVSTSPSVSPTTSFIKHFGGSSSITTSYAGLSQSSSSISSAAPVELLHSSSAASFRPQISKTSVPLSLPLGDTTSRSPLVTLQAPLIISQSTAPLDSGPTEVGSKPQPSVPQSPISEASTGLTADRKPTLVSSAASHSLSEIPPALSNLPSSTTKGKDEGPDSTITEEDEMEEEAPETNTTLNLGALGGFALGPASASSAPKTNPFGGSLITSTSNTTSAAFSLTTPTGELFRPASFSLPSSLPMQSSQPMNTGGFSGGFSGFGQPAQIGAGQQALGSMLGAFGQSRQLGVGVQGIGFASSSSFGGGSFSAAAMGGGGGFAAAAATGGGFSAVASSGGGFSGASGGFAAMASKPGGFAAAAAASAAVGFGTASGGGFGSFGAKQGYGGFSQFSGTSSTGSGKPPAELLMQMRK
uniref:Nuclear pore complex protein Nup214 n=1 Tax=Anthurium amnicola TaxID=1678845 RepID=A0A1D1Z7S4_9ARAE